MGFESDVQKHLCYDGCDREDKERCQAIHCPSWHGLGWVAGAGGDDVEDFGGPGSADTEVGLLREHLSQRLVGSGPLLWRVFLDGLVQDSKSLGLIDAIREEIQDDKVQRDVKGQRWAVPPVETDQDAVGVAVQQLHHVCRIPDVKQGKVEVDVGGSRDPDGPVADPPCGVCVGKVGGIDHGSHGRVIPTTGTDQSVKDDDPAIAPTGLGVIPEADAVALSTGCLPVLPVIRTVSTEASIA